MTGRPILRPVALGPLRLANRVVMAPMTRRRANADNVPSPLAATYYAQRASAGLIVSEATLVDPGGASYPGSPGIYSADQVVAWREVTAAVHARGGRMFLQLWHAGRVSDSSFLAGATPIAPSAVAIRGTFSTADGPRPFPVPRALGHDEIPGLVAAFGRAARAAMEAGFDGVEIHAAQGYLIDQFLRDGSNLRTDAYGGSVEGRARFLLEVVAAVSGAAGAERVGVQLSPASALNDMADADPPATFRYLAGRLDGLGLAYLHAFEPLAPGPRLTPVLRAAFSGPLIANGGYDGGAADAAIDSGAADLVSFGRPFIANPDLAERLAENVPLAEPDPKTFYGGGARGYTDYPLRSRR